MLVLKVRICVASTEMRYLLALAFTGYSGYADFNRQWQHIFEDFVWFGCIYVWFQVNISRSGQKFVIFLIKKMHFFVVFHHFSHFAHFLTLFYLMHFLNYFFVIILSQLTKQVLLF